MKVALIGAGRIGRLHGIVMASQPGVDEVVVADIDPDRAAETAAAFGGRVAPSIDTHDFHALRWVTGQEVDEVYAAGSVRGFPVFARHDDVDTGAAILQLADGTLGVLSQTRHDPLGYDIRMEIVGSRDAVTVGLGLRTPLRSLEPDAPAMSGPAWQTFLTRFETAYREELTLFLRVARGEIASPCTARDGLQAMRIAVAAGRSRSERRPIRPMDM